MQSLWSQCRAGWRLNRLVLHIVVGVVLTAFFAGLLRQSENQAFFRR